MIHEGRTMKLHAASEDYLAAILVLQQKQGMVRSVDVARYLEVTTPRLRWKSKFRFGKVNPCSAETNLSTFM